MKPYTSVREIKVGLAFDTIPIPVGRLAIHENTIYFEYLSSFLQNGFDLSPLRLPRQSGVFAFSPTIFEGLAGVFNDSLPDGWGRLLIDRYLRSQSFLPEALTPLDRLTFVGSGGMGALVYEPDQGTDESPSSIHLDALAEQTREVLNGRADAVLQELIDLNGSSAGARPKAMIGLDADRKKVIHGVHELPAGFQHWLVKFANIQDGEDAGAVEFAYSAMAKSAGIDVPDIHLFASAREAGHFSIRRFDRDGRRRFHVHTASGLLHSDFRFPALDYEDLAALTGKLTRDIRETEKMYRLAVFNVLAHNRDDHGKNFTFILNDLGEWKLAPAYDLTYSNGPRGEQSTTVMGEGRNPGTVHLTKLGRALGFTPSTIHSVIDQTQTALSQWRSLANESGVSRAQINLIAKQIGM